jgi:hypothetical protein
LSEGTQYDQDNLTMMGYKHVSYDNVTTMGYEHVKFRQCDHDRVQACNLAMTGHLSIGGKGECLHGFEQLGRVCIHSVF